MFDIGFSELLLTAVIALIVLGPERLPKAARTVGLIIGKIRRSFAGIQEELERQIRTEELREKMKDPFATYLDPEEQAARTQAEQTESKPVQDAANSKVSPATDKNPTESAPTKPSESGTPKS